MTLPETEELLLPLLKVIEKKDQYKVKEITDDVIDLLDLSEEEKNEKMPNNERVISARISTANTYLKKAELVELKGKGYYAITENGMNVLKENPKELTEEDLMKSPKFREYKKVFNHAKETNGETIPLSKMGPASMMEAAFLQEMEQLQKDMMKEAKKGNERKYFQAKDSSKYESKSKHREHMRKHKHSKDKSKYIIKFSPADELLKFAELFERGHITKEEFDRKKEELLNIKYRSF